MSFLSAIAGGGLSTLFGGITGAIAAIVKDVFAFKTKKLEFDQEYRMIDKQIEMEKIEANKDIMVARELVNVEHEKADAAGMMASINADKATYIEEAEHLSKLSRIWRDLGTMGLLVVDLVRGLIRPLITIYMCVLMYEIYASLTQLTGGLTAIPAEQRLQLYVMVIDGILYLAGMTIGWWFGSRGQKKAA